MAAEATRTTITGWEETVRAGIMKAPTTPRLTPRPMRAMRPLIRATRTTATTYSRSSASIGPVRTKSWKM